MSTQLTVTVRLDWSGPDHYDDEHPLPCRCGDGPTKMRDSQDRPCHLRCAEDEIARELYGRGEVLIADERFPTPPRARQAAPEARR